MLVVAECFGATNSAVVFPNMNFNQGLNFIDGYFSVIGTVVVSIVLPFVFDDPMDKVTGIPPGFLYCSMDAILIASAIWNLTIATSEWGHQHYTNPKLFSTNVYVLGFKIFSI
jgi:hypothetical protein